MANVKNQVNAWAATSNAMQHPQYLKSQYFCLQQLRLFSGSRKPGGLGRAARHARPCAKTLQGCSRRER